MAGAAMPSRSVASRAFVENGPRVVGAIVRRGCDAAWRYPSTRDASPALWTGGRRAGRHAEITYGAAAPRVTAWPRTTHASNIVRSGGQRNRVVSSHARSMTTRVTSIGRDRA